MIVRPAMMYGLETVALTKKTGGGRVEDAIFVRSDQKGQH